MRLPRTARRTAIAAALICLAGAFGAESPPGSSAPTSSAELVERASAYDGMRIVFEGEAIGEPLPRGEGAWVNVSDGGYAIGVWVPLADLALIENYGSYRGGGDRVRVLGAFNRACPEHGGDLDIHALSLEVVGRGAPTRRGADAAEAILAAALLAAGAIAFAAWRMREKSLLADRGKGT